MRMRFPKKELSIVVMSNNGSLWSEGLAKEIADIVLELNNETNSNVPVNMEDSPDFEDVTGIYLLADGTYIELTVNEGSLYRNIYGRDPVQLLHKGGNVYEYQSNSDLKLAFVKNDHGTYDFNLYYPGTAVRKAVLLSNPTYKESDHARVSGPYFNEETTTQFEINFKGEKNYEIKYNGRTREARSLNNNLIVSNNFNLKLVRDENQQIRHILLDYGRLKNVRFERQQ